MAAIDRYGPYGDDVSSPPTHTFALIPNDTDPVAEVTKGIFVGTGGQVTLRSVGSSADVTYKNLGNGSYIQGRIAFVRATGTTATDLVGEA